MSDRDNAASDILPGSTWEAPGARVRVLATAAGYVRFELADADEKILHHEAFRRSFATLYDRRQVRSQFSMSIANLVEFRAYWVPSSRRFIARSLTCSKKWPIPADAFLVGIYSQPFDPAAFLNDLDCAISTLETGAALRAAAL